MIKRTRHYCGITLLLASLMIMVSLSAGLLIDKELLAQITNKFGVNAKDRVIAWNGLILNNQQLSDAEKLQMVNNYFNKINFISDSKHWNKKDYWATPLEFITSNGGDCEDFSIAKYFTLRELGVPKERLRLTYVKSLTLNQAHMVLSYFDTPKSVPLILDNIDKKIKLASKRSDLVPVYSFNGESLWLAKERGQGRLMGSSRKISPWTKMIKRIQSVHMSS